MVRAALGDRQRRNGFGELQRFEDPRLVELGVSGETTLDCRDGADLRQQRDESATLRRGLPCARVREGNAKAYAYSYAYADSFPARSVDDCCAPALDRRREAADRRRELRRVAAPFGDSATAWAVGVAIVHAALANWVCFVGGVRAPRLDFGGADTGGRWLRGVAGAMRAGWLHFPPGPSARFSKRSDAHLRLSRGRFPLQDCAEPAHWRILERNTKLPALVIEGAPDNRAALGDTLI